MFFRRALLLLILQFLAPTCFSSPAPRSRSFVGPTSQVSPVDSTVEFRCRLLGVSPSDKVVWFSNGFPLGRPNPHLKDELGYSPFDNRPRFKARENLQTGEFRLQISPLRTEDAGTVQCQALATEMYGHVSSNQVNLTVQVPPGSADMRIQVRGGVFESRPEFVLRSNTTLLVRCDVAPGFPAPRVSWKIGRIQLEHSRNSVFVRTTSRQGSESGSGGGGSGESSSGVESLLTFVAEPWMDGKELTCQVEHPALERPMEKSSMLSVLYIPYVNISLQPERPVHREFSSLTAKCHVLARPEHTSIRWFVGGRPVEDESTDTLEVPSIGRQHHNTQIQCGAENSIGISYASVDVFVTYGPRFASKERPDDVWVDPREQVTLTCDDVDSNPPATVRWFRRSDVSYRELFAVDAETDGDDNSGDDVTNGGDGDDSRRHAHPEEEEVGEGPTLTFRPSDLKSFGLYACVASSPGFEAARREFLVGRKGRPVVLGPKEQMAVPGKIGSISCSIRGIPRPDRIVWYRNGELLDFDKEIRYSHKERDTRHGRLSTVEILDAVESDFAVFNCSAFSSHGFDSLLIVLRKKEFVPFYCWIASAAAAVMLMTILASTVVCYRRRKRMPGSGVAGVVCCREDKKLPSSDGSASTSQTSSDSMDLKRMCNLPDISIQHQQGKVYGPYGGRSPTFDSLEQKQKLLQVVGPDGVCPADKSYTRFESPNHHHQHHHHDHHLDHDQHHAPTTTYSYHPNRRYPCDSPGCQGAPGAATDPEDFPADDNGYGTCGSGPRGCRRERESFLGGPCQKPCAREDCAHGSTAFRAYSRTPGANLYGPAPVTSLGQRVEVDEREEDYVDDIRRSQYNPGICLLPPLTLNRQYYQPPSLGHVPLGHVPLGHAPLQYSPSSGGSVVYPPRVLSAKQPHSNSSYSSPSPTDSKLSTNV